METVSQTTVGGADFGRQRGTFHHLLLSAAHFQLSDATHSSADWWLHTSGAFKPNSFHMFEDYYDRECDGTDSNDR